MISEIFKVSDLIITHYSGFGSLVVDQVELDNLDNLISVYNSRGYEIVDISETFELRYQFEDRLILYQGVTQQFILDTMVNGTSFDTWDNLSEFQVLTEDIIRVFVSDLNLSKISRFQKLTESFILEFSTVLDWAYISRFQKLSDAFILANLDQIDVLMLFRYTRVSDLVIDEYRELLIRLGSYEFKTTMASDVDGSWMLDNIETHSNLSLDYINYIEVGVLTQTEIDYLVETGVLYENFLNSYENFLTYHKSSELLWFDDIPARFGDISIVSEFGLLRSDVVEVEPILLDLPVYPLVSGEVTHDGVSDYTKLGEDLDSISTDIGRLDNIKSHGISEYKIFQRVLLGVDRIIWDSVSRYSDLSVSFIRSFREDLVWDSVSKYTIFGIDTKSDSFVYEFQNYVDWVVVSKYQRLSESFIREFQDEVSWINISRYQRLSENFIREFKDYVDWRFISEHSSLYSQEFLEEFEIFLK